MKMHNIEDFDEDYIDPTIKSVVDKINSGEISKTDIEDEEIRNHPEVKKALGEDTESTDEAMKRVSSESTLKELNEELGGGDGI